MRGIRVRRCRSTRATRGVATVETLLSLPALIVLILLIVDFGAATVYRQRTWTAARQAAWQAAIIDSVPTSAELEDYVGVERVDLRRSSDGSDASGLGRIASYVPGFEIETVTVRSSFSPIYGELLGRGELEAHSSLLKGLWVTPSDKEGLWGYFKSTLGSGIAKTFSF